MRSLVVVEFGWSQAMSITDCLLLKAKGCFEARLIRDLVRKLESH